MELELSLQQMMDRHMQKNESASRYYTFHKIKSKDIGITDLHEKYKTSRS